MSLPAAALSCFFATILISSHHYNGFSIPMNINSSIVMSVVASNFKCSNVDIGETIMMYNQSGLYIEALQNTVLNCSIDANINNAGDSVILIDLGMQKGKTLRISTEAINSSTCQVKNATLISSELMPYVFNVQTISGPVSPFMNPGFLNAIIPGYMPALYKKFALQLENYTIVEEDKLPEFIQYSLPITEWPVERAVKNIIANLPIIFGLRFGSDNPSDTSLRINISTVEEVGDPKETVIDVPTFVKMTISKPFGVTLTGGVSNLVCGDSKFDCIAYRGAGLFNIHSTGVFAQQIPLLDKVIAPLVVSIANKGLGYATEKPFPIKIVDTEPIILPPYVVISTVLPILILCACVCVMFSYHRHIVKPAISDTTGEPISRRRVFAEDCLLSFSLFACMFMFVWSNSTDTATAFVANEINFASFSLVSSVRDLWEAKLRVLSILIMLFSGVYPYFKLLCIAIYCFVVRKPTSRMLIVLDNIGKFSMLDAYMLCILKSSLEVKGFGEAYVHKSFYVFVCATIGSIAVGNYGLHLWRYKTNLRPVERSCLEIADDKVEEFDKTKKWYQRIEWHLTVPAFVLVLIFSIINCVLKVVEFNISGFSTLIIESARSYTFSALLINIKSPFVTIVGLVMSIIAPLSMALFFPYGRFLTAWCATDVFLLTVIAMLLQLEQFLSHILGKTITPIFGASSSLKWPLIFFFFSAIIQWVFIAKHTFSIRGFPFYKFICKIIKRNN